MKQVRWGVFALMCVAALAASAGAQTEPGTIALTPLVGGSFPIQYLQSTEGGGMATFGFVAGALAEYIVDRNWSAGARFTYDRFGMDLEGDDVSGHWAMFEFGVFGRYVFLPDDAVRPFIRAGVLMGKAKATTEVNGSDAVELDISMSPGFELAGGATHKVAEKISLYGELAWTVIATDGADADVVVDGTVTTTGEMQKHLQWVGVKAGATFFLSK